MAYATPETRLRLRKHLKSQNIPFDYTIKVENGERQDELPCESLEHALKVFNTWVNEFKVDYVEIFRVLHDGTLNPVGKSYSV
jgi:hypothetical protein